MKIVIDMQGAQTASRFRGIGRYTLAFTQGVVRNRGNHEIILALSGLFPETIEPIRTAFEGLLPQENIRVWHTPGAVAGQDMSNDERREIAEIMREAFLSSLQPDVIHISSLFEGYDDDAVSSIGNFDEKTPVSVTLYDLIPLLNPDHYLSPNPSYKKHYLRKLEYLNKAKKFLAISEFSRQEGLVHLDLLESMVVNVSTAIESDFHAYTPDEKAVNIINSKYQIIRPFVLYSGATDERKNLPRLIRAYAALPLDIRNSHQIVLAGGMPQIHLIELQNVAKAAGIRNGELIFTHRVTDEELISLYKLCKLYVFPSWHEGFGLPVLEAMACGAPVICANSASLPEVIGLDEAMFDPFDEAGITSKMQQALLEEPFRQRLCSHGVQQAQLFSWDETAKRAISAWESIPLRNRSNSCLDVCKAEKRLYDLIAQNVSKLGESGLLQTSVCLALNQQEGNEKQLLVDISEIVQRNAKSGIQRVVRSILKEWLTNPPEGYRVEPVYATHETGYRYARRFVADFMCMPKAGLSDETIDFSQGDLFFCLDLQPDVQLVHREFYQHMRRQGIKVKFLVHDLLCIHMPQYFEPEVREWFVRWLDVVAESDGAICVSQTVAGELNEWVKVNHPEKLKLFDIKWSHNGADIEKSLPSQGFPHDTQMVLSQLKTCPSFLMVGTLEPRKGHTQVLDAFDLLWRAGVDVNLVVVGKQGWLVDELVQRLRSHQEVNKRLFWLEGASDQCLEKIYASSTCLIAASYGEGFGLPLIEAAQHKLPIIVRDIPVFREVAGTNAYYFNVKQSVELAQAIKSWLALYKRREHPNSANMHWLTWKESAVQLLKELNLPAPIKSSFSHLQSSHL